MSAVPVIINGVMMPKARGAQDKPVPAVFIGYASIAGLQVGGGPIIGDPDAPHPEHPIVLPDPPPEVPVDPPPTQPSPGIAVVIKPAPVTGGWGLAAKDDQLQWFFTPGATGAGPKR